MIITGIVAGVILVIILLYSILTYNSFVSLRNMYNEAFSTMDIYLSKRFDLLTKLADISKGYAVHEKETLMKIVEGRRGYSSLSPNEKIAQNMEIEKKLTNIYAVFEDYPELKANANFVELSKACVDVENDIEKSRRYYNGVARAFNTKILTFPSSIVAKLFHFQKVAMFTTEDEKRSDIDIQL